LIFERTKCPVCSGSNISHILTVDARQYIAHDKAFPDEKNWLGCKDCSHAFTREAWDRDQFRECLKNMPFGIDGEWEAVRYFDAFEHLRVILSATEKAETLCELGAGKAYMCAAGVDVGLKCTAVEAHPAYREKAEEIGAKFIEGFFEELELPPHDVVTMGDVLEHCTDPHEAFDRLPMGKHGVLNISTPRVDSSYYRATKWMGMWYVSDHMHFFSSMSLVKLAEAHGFRQADYKPAAAYRGCGAWTFVR
jgi:hypothetical protein